MNKDNRIIIALDFKNKDEVIAFLKNFNQPLYLKVGMELFYQEGKSIVEYLKKQGHQVFLDLKLHDIPNTVTSALNNLKELNVDMINIHCAGGYKMMQQASEVFKDTATKLIGVTQLTSTSQEMLEKELKILFKMDDVVVDYAKLAKMAGLVGVVCSGLEVEMIHQKVGQDFLCICPGIRLQPSDDDQVRVLTPRQAREIGANYIVVGRPITKANNPLEVYQEIEKEFYHE